MIHVTTFNLKKYYSYEKRVWGGQELGEEGGVVNEVGSGGTGLIINKSDSLFFGRKSIPGCGKFYGVPTVDYHG